jgi:predicted small integral membrane protein
VKVIAWLAGLATLLTAALYMIVSLNRWEWNRALFFGLIVLIAEIALATGLVLRKLSHLQALAKADPDVADILRDARPGAPDRFAWLRESTTRTNVFITFLVGGGVVLSGVAWLVDRIAASSSTPHGEAKLASLLTPISYPAGGLIVDDTTALAQDVPGADDAQLRRLLGGDHSR